MRPQLQEQDQPASVRQTLIFRSPRQWTSSCSREFIRQVFNLN
ncbi:hypothetical protein [Oscillatoria sp. FACHB-1407]|nr:hypothetical protein [Oscillatoria sp. FACHB-1407]